jgi:hypothetical protein
MRYGKVIDGVFDDSISFNDLWARVEPGDLRIAGSGDQGSGWPVRLGCMPVCHEGGRCKILHFDRPTTCILPPVLPRG